MRRNDLHDRHVAQAMQDEEDTNHMAADWVTFFQSQADNEIPDFCQDS